MDIWVRIEELVQDAVESQGFELVHVERKGRGSAAVLRIYIDKSGGVSLADCQAVSRHVGVLLDVEDLIPHRYTLEVSSPGLERPLFKAPDYERFAGREIRLEAGELIGNRKRFTGILLGISDGLVRLRCDGQVFEVPLKNIKKANLVYKFD